MSCILCSDAQGCGSGYAQLKTFFSFALTEQIIGTLAVRRGGGTLAPTFYFIKNSLKLTSSIPSNVFPEKLSRVITFFG